jgi:pimeloyl-ACP methyl ester carboxylesterase
MTQILSFFVRVPDGGSLNVLDTAAGEPAVLLCHAFTGDAMSWAAQIPAFAGAGLRAISYSRRGAGESSPPGTTVTQSADAIAVLDALGVEAFHVVGIAGGGATALDLALSCPERVASVTVACSMMGFDDPVVKARLAELHAGPFGGYSHGQKELSERFRREHPQEAAEWLEVAERSVAAGPPPRQPLAHAMTYAAIGTIRRPMLLITGAEDLYMPPDRLREVAARWLPHARVEIIADAAHAAPIEQPEAFNRLVLDFLAEQAAG